MCVCVHVRACTCLNVVGSGGGGIVIVAVVILVVVMVVVGVCVWGGVWFEVKFVQVYTIQCE